MVIEQARLDFTLLLDSQAGYLLAEGPNSVNISMQAAPSENERVGVTGHDKAKTHSLPSTFTSVSLETANSPSVDKIECFSASNQVHPPLCPRTSSDESGITLDTFERVHSESSLKERANNNGPHNAKPSSLSSMSSSPGINKGSSALIPVQGPRLYPRQSPTIEFGEMIPHGIQLLILNHSRKTDLDTAEHTTGLFVIYPVTALR
ncbi:hypothetical protein C8J55DRAFT_486782 [Lentinula edodes]|uniref:Uncharacterized protein n=1 Tax=Lentinula lateritia TaxID=40482 RepID=A0A9W9AU52_9AGAR|nr:hypothetical protein C8J55DRAFT_486782 [Lentinula edodes]